jgi:RNA polymerase sigma-70 factor (ECF subfamily)
MQILEDHKLVRQSRQGDRQAFEAIYEKYLDPMLTIAMNLLGDWALAEDIVQEVFVKFIQSLKDFTLRGTLKGYLATCVANRARDLLRQKIRRQDRPLDTAAPMPADSQEPIYLAVRNEQLQILQNGLNTLPYEQREAITLRHQGGLRFKEIAACQGVSIQTVQSRYAYGMEKLRHLLNGEVSQ